MEHDSTCITVEECPAVGDVCTGGKEWLECGTACPLTCDNYDNPPFACTLQCVQGCFCPAGKVDLNGVCVESSTCAGGLSSNDFILHVTEYFLLQDVSTVKRVRRALQLIQRTMSMPTARIPLLVLMSIMLCLP